MNNYPNIPKLAVYSGSSLLFIHYNEIIYITSDVDNSLTSIQLVENRSINSSKSLKELESELPDEMFLRLHNSYIINMVHLDHYIHDDNEKVIMKEGAEIPVSRRKKQSFLSKFIKF